MDEIESVRRAVLERGPRRPGRRVPPALQRRVVAVVRELRRQGQSIRAIAQRLGVSAESIRRWGEAEPAAALVPVRIASPAPVPLTTSAPEGGMVLVSPNGFRVEGLGLEEAAELLRRLS